MNIARHAAGADPAGTRKARRPHGLPSRTASWIRSRPLRAASALLLLPLGTAAAVVGIASTASAAPTIPPAAGHNVIVFPERDFVSATGYAAGSTVTVQVVRKINGVDTVVSTSLPAFPQDDPRTPGFDGLVEVNHPGGVCWDTLTPDIRPGDKVLLHEVNAGLGIDFTDGTVTSNVVVTQPATNTAAGTIEVHGTAANADGTPIDITTLDQRLVANKDAFDLNGRRTLRAASVLDDGLLSYDAPGSTHWTAVYTGLDAADIARAVGAESRILWLGTVPAAVNESTIYEYGAVGGPTAGCNAPLNAPVATVTPADVLFSATATGTDSAATTLTVANTGAGPNADLTVASITSDSPDFVVSGTACAAAIPTGTSCATQTVTFHPATPGLKTGTLTVKSDGKNGDQKVTVTGLAVDPAADPAARIVARPTSLTFATRLPGTTSPASRVTLTNIGNASVTPDSVAIEDAAATPNYTVSATTCAAAIAPDASCTVDVTFSPNAVGPRPAALVTKVGATTLSSVPLAGKGLDVVNVNDPPILPTSILVFSVRDFVSSSGFAATDTVSVEVIRHGVVVGFVADQIPQDDPLTDGFDGLVEINHPGGGCWAAPVTPDIRPGDIVRTIISNPTDPTRDGRADQTHVVDVGTYTAGADDGNGHLVIKGWARGTDGKPIPVGQLSQRFVANKQAFVVNGRRTLRAGFGGGEGTIAYDPVGPGNLDGSNWTATYTVPQADINRALTTSEARIIWLGRDPLALFEGTFYEFGQVGGPAPAFCTTPAAPPTPDYEYAPNALTFPTRGVDTAVSPVKNVVLRNTGTADLHVSSVGLGGTDPTQFVLDGATTCAAGLTLTPGQSCTFAVAFNPTGTPGPRSATIDVEDDVVGPPQHVALSGLASAGTVAYATVSPAELVFPPAALHAVSAFKRVTVTNEGQADLVLGDVVSFAGTNGSATTHDFAVAATPNADTCTNQTVPAGGQCHVDVTFTGSALNERTDTLKIAATPALSVALSGSVNKVGLINDPPAGGHAILVFPERDFISSTGYQPTDNVTVQVVRNGKRIGVVTNVVPQDDPTTPGFDGLVEVNHPGGVCWANNLVPDIRPGDVVQIFPNGITQGDDVNNPVNSPGDQTHTQGVIVTQAATQTAPDTVVVKGTATDVFTGGRIPIGQLEVRIINKQLFDANGKRTLRSGPNLDGTMAYDTPTSKTWTATFTNLTPADVQRTIENIDPTGKNIGGETRGLWLGRDPLALNELTFDEHGVVGGAVAPCTGTLTAAALTSTPASAVFATQVFASAAPQVIHLTITNVGTLDANLEAPVITGGNAPGDFTILPDAVNKCPVAPKVLEFSGAPPFPTCTIDVQFLPSARGLRTSTLSLASDATPNPLVVPLSGIAAVTPTLTSLSSSTSAVGTPITLTGSGFLGATQVSFGATNIPAAGFTVVSDTTITTNVPAVVGSAPVTVTNLAGTSNSLPFTTAAPPTVTTFAPLSGSPNLKNPNGTPANFTVTIQGTDLTGGGQPAQTRVLFNGVAGTVTAVTATSVTAQVPAGAQSGPITVVTALGQAVTAGSFTVLTTPAITSITGAATKPGSTATVNGTGFTVNAGNGASPSNVVLRRTNAADLTGTAPARTATTIRFTVPANAAGPYNLVVQTPVTLGGTQYVLESPVPQVLNAIANPSVTGACAFATQADAVAGNCANTTFAAGTGNWVRIQGAGLYGTSAVSFGGQKATVFSLPGSDPTLQGGVLVAQVPAGSKSGAVQVTAPGGSASANGFTFVGTPTISVVSPTTAARGANVTLTGTGFVNSTVKNVTITLTAVADGSVKTLVAPVGVTVTSATSVTFTLPANTVTGLNTIQVTTVGGTATSPQRVTVT